MNGRSDCGGYAIAVTLNASLYCVSVTNADSAIFRGGAKPSKFGSTNTCVSWRARSARKFMKHDRVAVDDRFAVADDGGFDEFVGFAARVRRFERGDAGVCMEFGARVGDRVVGEFDALPAFVAIHRVVAAGNRGDGRVADVGAFALQFLDAMRARFAAACRGRRGTRAPRRSSRRSRARRRASRRCDLPGCARRPG